LNKDNEYKNQIEYKTLTLTRGTQHTIGFTCGFKKKKPWSDTWQSQFIAVNYL